MFNIFIFLECELKITYSSVGSKHTTTLVKDNKGVLSAKFESNSAQAVIISWATYKSAMR